MRIRAKVAGAVAALAAAAAAALAPGVAVAHEGRTVDDLDMTVGFGTEPAYTGQPNSVQLILARGGRPVTDLGDALRVEVTHGEVSTRLVLEPNFAVGGFGEPGDYRAWFVPSEPGAYTFRFAGRVGGVRVDETFTSGPDTFSEVQDIGGATFPEVTAPSSQELADRIERESARTADGLDAATAAASDAEEAASGARTIALIGVLVGGLGLVVGIAGLALARRAA